MTPKENILAMADLLVAEGAWTQYSPGRTPLGMSVSPNDPRATSWCIMGALDKVTRGKFTEELWITESILHSYLRPSPQKYNDKPRQTQAEVVARLRHIAIFLP